MTAASENETPAKAAESVELAAGHPNTGAGKPSRSGGGAGKFALKVPAAHLPAAMLLLLAGGVPLLNTLRVAFSHPRLFGDSLAEDGYRHALTNTLALCLVSVPLEVAGGLAFALLLRRMGPGRGWLRAALILPWALPSAVMAMGWAFLLHDRYGLVTDLLLRTGLSEPGDPALLARPATAFAAIVLVDVWKTAPFAALILLAGLAAIPRELEEALRADGANAWQRFTRLTLPYLRGPLILATGFRFLQTLGLFDPVQVLTGGGPAGATETLALHLYRTLFRHLHPEAAAVQNLLLALVAGLPLLAWAWFRARRNSQPAALRTEAAQT